MTEAIRVTDAAVLPRLVSVDPDRFAADYWGRAALLSAASDLPAGFGDLLDSDAIDELLSSRGLRTPFLRVAKDGTTLSDRSFTGPGGVGAGIADQISDDKLVRLFGDGSTIVLQALHRTWPPILALCQSLAAELGHPVQANAYVTPPQNQGFSDHYDVHDVFVLQIEGHKRWQIHAPVLESPLRDQPWSDRKAAVAERAAEAPLIEAVLSPGDCLYLPRGFLHAAQALGGTSIHLTIGVHTWTRHTLAEQMLHQALSALARQPEVRRSLPMGVEVAEPATFEADIEVVRSALRAAVDAVNLPALGRALTAESRRTQRAAPVGPLRQLRTANELTGDTTILLREHLAATLEVRSDGLVLRSRAGEMTLTEAEADSVRELLAGGQTDAGQLGVALSRRLLLAGVAVAR